MTLQELLTVDVEQESITVDSLYQLGVLESLSDNKIDLFQIESDKEKYRDLVDKFSKKTFHRGNQDYIELSLLYYDNKPVLLYEVYKDDSYWHINILDNIIYSIISKIIMRQIELEYQNKSSTDIDKLSWLDKYYIVTDKFESSEVVGRYF